MIKLILITIGLLVVNGIYMTLAIAKTELNEDSEDKKYLASIITNYLMILLLFALTAIYFEKLLFSFLDSSILSVILTAFLIGIIVLIFSVIPYLSISKNKPEKVLKHLKIFDQFAYYLFGPFCLLYLKIRKIFFKKAKEVMTEDEFLTYIDLAEEQLGINKNESQLIKNVLEFDETKVLDIYTPRTEIVAVNNEATIEEVKAVFKQSGFSRIPIYIESLDNIIGTINFKEFTNKEITNKKELQKIIVKPIEVTEYMNLNDLLSLLKKNQQHLAIVKDEFGGTLGIVTLEDILEELVGDIYDEHDKMSVNILKKSDKIYHVLGQTYLCELEDIFDIS